MPSLARILSAPLRTATAAPAAVRAPRGRRAAPLLPAPITWRTISSGSPRHDRQPLRPAAPTPLVLELSAPTIASTTPLQARAQAPLADRGDSSTADPPEPAPRAAAPPLPSRRMAAPLVARETPAARSAIAPPAARERTSAAEAQRRPPDRAPAAPQPQPQTPGARPAVDPARAVTPGTPVRPAAPERPPDTSAWDMWGPGPDTSPLAGAARGEREQTRPTRAAEPAPAAVVPAPAADRAPHDTVAPQPGRRDDRPVAMPSAPQQPPALPAATPPPPQQVVHVHEPAPPPPEQPPPPALRPSPQPATPAAVAPPQAPRPAAAPARAAVSIEIGRIEIRTAQPRAAAPPAPPRRVTPARRHVIDPGLRLGGGRRW